MARTEIPAPADILMDSKGNVLPGQTVTVKLAGTATNATHYSALTGGTSTTGGLVTAADGTIVNGSGSRRYVDSGQALDITIAGLSRQVEPVSASVESRSGGWINVAAPPYNATGDGTTDDTVALTAAVAAARAAGKRVYLPKGIYKITSSITGSETTPLNVVGDGMGLTVINQATSGAPAIQSAGTLGATRAVTVASVIGASTLTLADASGIVQGDVLNIIDTTVPVYGNSTRIVVASQSEHGLVQSVAGNVVTFYGRLRYAYSTSATAQLLAAAGAVQIQGLTMRNPNPGTRAGTDRAIQLAHMRDAVVKDVEFLDYDGAQIYMTNVVGWDVGGCSFKRARDLEQATTPYCVMAKDGTSHGIMHDCRGEYVRHMYTTSAQASTVTPQHNLITDCIGWGCTQAVVDTHPGAPWHTFTNITGHHCADALAQIRGPDSRVINPVAFGCLQGVNFVDGAHRGRLLGGRLSGCDVAVTVQSSEDCFVGGNLLIDDPVTNGFVYTRGANWAAFLNYKLTFGDFAVTGNPSGAAVDLGNWNNAFRIKGGPGQVWIPDATTKWAQRAIYTVAAATTLTLPPESDIWAVTGTTAITTITATTADINRVVILHMQGTATVTDGNNIHLDSNTSSTGAAGRTLMLWCDGTTWIELSRRAT